jgi:hypothetical protein
MQILHTLFFGLRLFLVSAGVITLLVGAVGVPPAEALRAL